MRIFDAHFHIIDPRFPLIPNQGYLPEFFTRADYGRRTEGMDIQGGAVVSGSFQGFDQTYLLAALKELGPAFVGVTQLPASVPDEEVLRLDRSGVRAVRFNLRRGGGVDLDRLAYLACKVHEVAGWHCELYVDSRELPELLSWLRRLPLLVIDHLGLSREGLSGLRHAVEHGAFVKATGFGRLDFDPEPVLRELAAINPEALLFGTDLPSTRAPRPFRSVDLEMLARVVDAAVLERVLFWNAFSLYRPRAAGLAGSSADPQEQRPPCSAA